MTFYVLGAFSIGFGLAMLLSRGGPVALGMARRRGFWVGWESRGHYPADAPPRTRREVDELLWEDERRIEGELEREFGRPDPSPRGGCPRQRSRRFRRVRTPGRPSGTDGE